MNAQINPKNCPFMRENAPLLRGIAASATPEQRAAVHQLPADYKQMVARHGATPATKAWYITQWLRRLGQHPARYARHLWRGRVVHPDDVAHIVRANRRASPSD